MRNVWNFCTPGRLMFGSGSVIEAGHALSRFQPSRAMLITDQALVNAGAAEKVSDSLKASDIEVVVHAGGEPEPSFDVVAAAVEAAQDIKPDAIVGLGGGSNMDLAKATAILLSHGGSIGDYVGWDELPGPILPLMCLPTTSGTSSEISGTAVLTDKANQLKVAILSPHLRPDIALIDPELTLSCPKKATADSGIDALTHAVEAYLATTSFDMKADLGQWLPYEGKHPLGDCLGERAIRLIGQHLVRAVNEPDCLEAREGMALGAMFAGLAFSNCGVGLVHAMEYPLGGVLHVSHGEGNGLLLPHVMRYVKSVREKELARIAVLLGEEESADAAIEKVVEIQNAIGIRTRVRDLGATQEQLPMLAAKAFSIKRLMDLTPRSPSESDILEVYRAAF